MSVPPDAARLREREPTGPERRRYAITEVGAEEVRAWLSEPAPPEPGLQNELFAKLVIALLLGRSQQGSTLDVLLAGHSLY